LATRQCRATSSTGSSGCGWIGDDGGSGELRSQRVGGSRTMAADPRRGWTEDGGGGSGELWIPDVGGSRMMAAADPKRGGPRMAAERTRMADLADRGSQARVNRRWQLLLWRVRGLQRTAFCDGGGGEWWRRWRRRREDWVAATSKCTLFYLFVSVI
jgi:hypothetical protein